MDAEAGPTRRHRRIRAGSLTAGIAVLVAAGTGIAQLDRPSRHAPGPSATAASACGTTPSPAAPTPGVTPFPANQQFLNSVALGIEADASARFPRSYTGVAIDTRADLVRVYRIPDQDLDRWLSGAVRSTCVVLIDTTHPRAELVALQQRIAADHEYWITQGVTFYLVSISLPGSTLEVTTLDAEKAKQLFPGRYGSDAPIVIVQRGPDIVY
jgi:hypothetical protein